MGILTVIQRLRSEFSDMPGLRLTAAQAARLCSVDRSTSASALCALVSTGFLSPMPNGRYGRTDTISGTRGPQFTQARGWTSHENLGN